MCVCVCVCVCVCARAPPRMEFFWLLFCFYLVLMCFLLLCFVFVCLFGFFLLAELAFLVCLNFAEDRIKQACLFTNK